MIENKRLTAKKAEPDQAPNLNSQDQPIIEADIHRPAAASQPHRKYRAATLRAAVETQLEDGRPTANQKLVISKSSMRYCNSSMFVRDSGHIDNLSAALRSKLQT